MSFAAVVLAALGSAPAAQPQVRPLPIEAVLGVMEDDVFAGANPSPDGRLIAYDLADPREALDFEYANQSFTFDGYPMWASMARYRTRITTRDGAQTLVFNSPTGTSWSGSWSPDGRYYAFYSNRSGLAAVWIWDSKDGSMRKISDTVPRVFRNTDRPLWTPDARQIVFKAVPQGMTLTELHRLNPNSVANGQTDISRSSEEANEVQVRVYNSHEPGAKSPGTNWAVDYRFLSDLVAVDVETGRIRRIASRVHPTRYSISPDGKWVASIDLGGLRPNTMLASRSVWIYPLAGGTGKRIAGDVVTPDPSSLSWSPDSTRLAYVALEEGDSTATAIYRCYVARIATGAKVVISAALTGRPRLDRSPPLWSPQADRVFLIESWTAQEQSFLSSKAGHLWELAADGSGGREITGFGGRSVQELVSEPGAERYWSPDAGRTLVVATRDDTTKKEAFFRVDTLKGKVELLGEFNATLHHFPKGAAGDREHFLFFREDAAHPTELFSMNVVTREVKQLSHANPVFEHIKVGQSRLVSWMSAKGESLQGALLLPPDHRSDRRYPLVVWMYGGNHGSDKVNAFSFGESANFNFQVLATRGYAVLYPDIPMKGHAPLRDVESAVIPAVNRLIELGIADPNALAVMGSSYGGYNTLGLITRTQRFKAAIASSSIAADFFEGYARFHHGIPDTGYYEAGQARMGGTPWQFPERYRENSPFFALDRVTTPLLLQRGVKDPISSANGAVYVSLKRLGVETQFLEYENEGHVLQRPANVIDFWNRRLEWLDRHLGGGS